MLGGATLAAVMFLAAASSVVESKAPDLAISLFPMNAGAQARIAEAEFAKGANARIAEPASGTRELERAAAIARQSLANLPLNPRALRILALSDPQSPGTQSLLRAGHSQSRRDTLTQVYLIEFAAQAGEIGQAMDHYDAVLRRRSAYRDPAGRNLAAALTLPGVLEEVAGQLPEAPSWESLLYFYVLRTPESFASFVKLHRMLAGTDTIPSQVSAQFANTLVERGQIDEAFEIAELAGPRPLPRRTALVETAFDTPPPPGDALPAIWPGQWITPEDADAFLQPIHGGGALINLSSGASGILAFRLVALEPGDYAAFVTITPDENADMGAKAAAAAPPIEARLSCAVPQTGTGRAAQHSRANFTVGGDCPYQWLTLALPQTQTRAEDIFVDAVTIQPAR